MELGIGHWALGKPLQGGYAYGHGALGIGRWELGHWALGIGRSEC